MGLISNALPSTKLKPFNPDKQFTEANSFGYDPKLSTVNTGTDTVSGQLDSILSKDNPYVTRARSSAAGVANSRGLLNSTMAAQAGEAAAIDAALPIATQDANTFSTQRLTNQQAENTADQFGAGAANQAGIINANAGNQIVQQKLVGEQNLGQIEAQGEQARSTLAQSGEQALKAISATGAEESKIAAQKAQSDLAMQVQKASDEMRVQGLKGTQAEVLANVEGTYRELLQASAAAASLYTNISRGITDILQNNDLDPAAKQAAIDTHINMIQGGLGVIGGVADIQPPLSSLLSF